MPFMRSESCSFIWQPNVVTWNDFTAVEGSQLQLRIEGVPEGREFGWGG